MAHDLLHESATHGFETLCLHKKGPTTNAPRTFVKTTLSKSDQLQTIYCQVYTECHLSFG